MSKITLESPIRLDVAVARTLLEPVDAANRAELKASQAVMQSKGVVPEPIDPPSLVSEVFATIIPSLTNPGVLRLERRRLLLDRLEARVSARSHDDALAAGGLMALRHELASLMLLRRNRDSLIEG